MAKRVYFFDDPEPVGRELLGGKGAGLAEMTRIGLPVPYGFTITTEVCREYYALGGKMPDGLKEETVQAMRKVEEKTGKKFGDPTNPLLVSVRSGARVSMPGMMDTILNLGLNDETVKGLARLTSNERFAWDSYRRFVMMFSDVVLGIPKDEFEKILDEVKEHEGVKFDAEVSAEGLKQVAERSKLLVEKELGRPFPQDVWEQLFMAIEAVFRSWNNPRAILYRQLNGIPDDWGTAVNIVEMVFGNMGDDSGTGVAFTRNPATGEKELYGEYLANAQGEDVVAGVRTPKPIKEMQNEWPQTYQQLLQVAELLEKHFKDMQDMEFTVERGKLYMLQTRSGKRTAEAAVRIASEMAQEGLISKEDAVLRITPEEINRLLHKRIDHKAKGNPVAVGLAASPGAAVGEVVFSADEAVAEANAGKKVILVRPETTPDDLHGMVAAQGILTTRGGMTSHAAVIARGMGKPAVTGTESLRLDLDNGIIYAPNGVVIKRGDVITLDGGTGEVFLGALPLVEPEMSKYSEQILAWADEFRRLGVKANADTPEDAALARSFGAEGIGLTRTEHMFLGPERVQVVQDMIMAETSEERIKPLERLLELQKGDFVGILKAMDGLPVTIRLLDPPLHEFLPEPGEIEEQIEEAMKRGASEKEIEKLNKLFRRAVQLQEHNPMMGFRGCRLGIVYPEIYEMQVRAVAEAAVELKKQGYNPRFQIMHPLVGTESEMKFLADMTHKVVKEIFEKAGVELDYKVGTMIEVPRAALVAGDLAKYAEFFSFGTNDLTQMTYAYSRDDAEGKFLGHYVEKGILPENPFITLDTQGVGRLISMAVTEGRQTRPDIEIGICGEHGGDPRSIEFCHRAGLDYVSASPYRVPVARLAAAHAAIKEKRGEVFRDK
ncbi:pyruvate, phosphate dikinase [Coprothermobacteraceae bacterium]|nr:pyruvate, phosphate dikinase [Coprothermobacteraceae bacterium]